MPYEWQDEGDTSRLTARPFRSLPRQGFVWVIGLTAAALTLPLLAVIGTKLLWGLLPFAALAVLGIWIGLQRSYRSGETREDLEITPDRLTLIRRDPGRPDRSWQTNPYWVRATLRDGPVEDYLTLTDGQREIELGAFLTPDERRTLHGQLLRRLADQRQTPAPARPKG